MNPAVISSQMQSANRRTTVNYRNGGNSDIISVIHRNFPKALEIVTAKGAYKSLQGNSARESAQNVWNFLKHSIQYKEDPQSHQMIRLPNRLLLDRVGDCKSFSLFAAAMLSAMGLPVAFRYASYSQSPIPTHVYVVTQDEAGREIIVDAVWKSFDSEKPYTFKRDHVMKVSTLSGIGLFNKKKRQERKEKRKEKREERKEKRQERREQKAEKRGGARGVKRIALAPGRGAFLSLILLNFRGLATKMAASIQRNPDRTKKLWNKLGGDFNKLKQAVDKGKTKKRILGLEEYEIEGIGSAAALAATAAPIIIAVVKFLKGEGIDDADNKTLLETGLDVLNKSGEKELPNNLAELGVEDPEPGSGLPPAGGGGLFENKNILLIGGAAAVGILLLLKRK